MLNTLNIQLLNWGRCTLYYTWLIKQTCNFIKFYIEILNFYKELARIQQEKLLIEAKYLPTMQILQNPISIKEIS